MKYYGLKQKFDSVSQLQWSEQIFRLRHLPFSVDNRAVTFIYWTEKNSTVTNSHDVTMIEVRYHLFPCNSLIFTITNNVSTEIVITFIGPCIIVIAEEWKTNLMSLAILFHFLCAQHVSDINISIIRSLRLYCWITTLVVLFLVRCVLEFRCGLVGVVSVLQAEAQLQPATRIPLQPNHTETPTHIEPRTIRPMW